jgi:N-acylneuraminate cytidylyltransferase
MKSIAIITARGGSKRIPRKNVRFFLGQPIIVYSIQAAIGAKIFDEIMVSTDSEEIANVAKEYGANIPFMRSSRTSDDYATTSDVIKEVIECYQEKGVQFEHVCCIYPTAPFVTSDKLKASFQLLKDFGVDSVVPVTKFSFPIWRSFKMEGNKISYNWPEFALKRSQDLPPAYHDCGQFYFFKCEEFLKTGKLVTDNTIGLEVSESEVQDIDNEEDWKMAEIKYNVFKEK